MRDLNSIRPSAEGCLALRSVVGRRAVDLKVLLPMRAAAKHRHSGDKALANLRLVFAGLPALHEPADLRHCEKHSDKAIQGRREAMPQDELSGPGLLRFARNDAPRFSPPGRGDLAKARAETHRDIDATIQIED